MIIMAMGKVMIGDLGPQKTMITKIASQYGVNHVPETGQGTSRGELVMYPGEELVTRYPVLAVTRSAKPARSPHKLVGVPPEDFRRTVRTSKSDRIRAAHSNDRDAFTARSLPDSLSPNRLKASLKQPSPPVVRSTPKRGNSMPSIANKHCNAATFERDFWTYWKSVKSGRVHHDTCSGEESKDEPYVRAESTLDLESQTIRRHAHSSSSFSDPDKLSIKHIFKFLNMSDMNVVKRNRNSLERVRLQQKSIRKRGHTLTTVEMALKNARRYRHHDKHASGVTASAQCAQEGLGPIVNSPLLKDTQQAHMKQPIMPVEKAVKQHSYTYNSKQRSRRIREVFVTKKAPLQKHSNVPQSLTLAVFSRGQVPEVTGDSLDTVLSHRTATVHGNGRDAGYWVEGKNLRTRSQPQVVEDNSSVVRLPKVHMDLDDAENGITLVNFSKITEKMNTMGLANNDMNEEAPNVGKELLKSAVMSSNSDVRKCPKKHVNIHLPNTS